MPRLPKRLNIPASNKTIDEQARREPSTRRLYGKARWRKLRAWKLTENPFCEECLRHDTLTPANDIDHIKPHRGNPALFHDPANLQSLCHSCHSRKTAREEGGFGDPTAR